jgi:hypothetical protein
LPRRSNPPDGVPTPCYEYDSFSIFERLKIVNGVLSGVGRTPHSALRFFATLPMSDKGCGMDSRFHGNDGNEKGARNPPLRSITMDSRLRGNDI